MWHSRPPRDPPPLHGKCHLKFPFWFFAHLPYRFYRTTHISWTPKAFSNSASSRPESRGEVHRVHKLAPHRCFPWKEFSMFPLKDDLVKRCRDKKKKAHLQSPEPSVPRSRRSREVPPSSILSSQNHSRCSSDTWEKTSVNICSWILFAFVVIFL